MKVLAPVAALVLCLAASAAARAQNADGTYPGTLFCEAGAGGGAVNQAITVTIAGGRASYAFPVGGGRETGTGTVSGSRLVLVGRGTGPGAYEARYAGEVSGRGGLLIGTQTGKGFRRACQISIGQGRA